MDAAEYLPMFLAECRENLQELNNALVRLEEHPDHRETLDEIFRIAHSLKGMSATMGFERMASLTHAMEDVFELLRQRHGGVDRDGLDVVFACLDGLGAAVDGLDANGVEDLDPAVLIERLHNLVRGHDAEEGSPEAEAPSPDVVVAAALVEGKHVLRIAATLADDCSMPSVRAYMLLEALRREGEILAARPAEDELEGFAGRLVEVWVAAEDDDALAKAAGLVADIVSVDVSAEGDTTAAEEVVELSPAEGADAAAPTAQRGHKTSSTVRVDSERLDQLMHLMGELVVQRTRLEGFVAHASVPGLSEAMQDLTRSSQALQSMVMQVRMIPVEAVFLRFPRLVRDLSTKLDKKVELTLSGQDTELDRSGVEALGDPLVHLVRNSLDHGLEPPEERRAAGKPEVGSLEISARYAGGSVLITVRDDGRGIDPARVAATAVKRGVIPPEAAETIDMQGAIELLFLPGFSTAEETTDVSGRGVGMDAVASAVRGLGGDVFLSSELGAGTVAQIRMPLTLAIISALLVEARAVPFGLPLERVETTLRLADHPIRSVAGNRMLVLRDGSIPLLDLADVLGYGSAHEPTHAVIVRGADRRLALEVDQLVGQRELVTRPLPEEVGRGGGFSGGAVLSSGDIVLVVDCDALAATVRGQTSLIANAA